MITPTLDYRRTDHKTPDRMLHGIDARVDSAFGIYKRRGSVLSNLRSQAEQIDSEAKRWKDLSNQDLHERLIEFRERFRRGGKSADELPDG